MVGDPGHVAGLHHALRFVIHHSSSVLIHVMCVRRGNELGERVNLLHDLHRA